MTDLAGFLKRMKVKQGSIALSDADTVKVDSLLKVLNINVDYICATESPANSPTKTTRSPEPLARRRTQRKAGRPEEANSPVKTTAGETSSPEPMARTRRAAKGRPTAAEGRRLPRTTQREEKAPTPTKVTRARATTRWFSWRGGEERRTPEFCRQLRALLRVQLDESGLQLVDIHTQMSLNCELADVRLRGKTDLCITGLKEDIQDALVSDAISVALMLLELKAKKVLMN
jgi:hypothetical protein